MSNVGASLMHLGRIIVCQAARSRTATTPHSVNTRLFTMFPSLPSFGGYLWKKAPRLSVPQKYRLRLRMRQVDHNIAVLFESLKPEGASETPYPKINRLFALPKEAEMSPRDKYTTFNKKSKDYRKSVHLVPKWTKKLFRENPKYF